MAQPNQIYMDYSSYCPIEPRVLKEMLPYYERYFGNPSSPHSFGVQMKAGLEGAREKVASLINAEKPSEVIFTSGSTESINAALRGAAFRNKEKGNRIIASSIEHISVRNTLKYLAKNGFEVVYLPVDEYGVVSVEALKGAMNDRTVLVTVMYANNEVGTVEPIKEIADIVHEKNAILHTDATAAIGKMSIDVNRDGIDIMSISSGDTYGPYGIGALYLRRGIRFEPLILGGGQEAGFRSGTENVAGAVGMGKAAEIAKAEMAQEAERLSKIRDRIIKGTKEAITYSFLNGHPTLRLPNNINMRFSFIEGESLVLSLDMEGIAASSGSACSSKTLEPSHVLLAMGIPHEEAQGSLLLSLGRWNTPQDAEKLLEVLPNIVRGLREMSPIAPPGVR